MMIETKRYTAFLFLLIMFIVICAIVPAMAKPNPKYASLVMDADTGLILHHRYADKRLHPASLTKMMTMVLTFEAMDRGRMRPNDRIRISKHAASMVPSKLGISAGGSIRVKDALSALATKSANDVAVALAERIGGSEREFARLMTIRARDIGMSRTTFKNASGLHHPSQISTARDMAKLARYILVKYPHHYHYFSKKSFTFGGKTYKNHNKLLSNYAGTDGFKTGYINASGFNLVASAKRDGRRIIGVVFGGRSGKTRNAHMVQLLDKGFQKLDRVRLVAAREAPRPSRKPAFGAEDTNYTSLAALTQRTETVRPPVMDIGAFSQLIGQGDIDPSVSRRLETGLVAIAAHTGQDSRYNALQPLAGTTNTNFNTAPLHLKQTDHSHEGRWSVQIGAFSAKRQGQDALHSALLALPTGFAKPKATLVPLKTESGVVYRARLNGFSKTQALQACKYFKDCMTIAPR